MDPWDIPPPRRSRANAKNSGWRRGGVFQPVNPQQGIPAPLWQQGGQQGGQHGGQGFNDLPPEPSFAPPTLHQSGGFGGQSGEWPPAPSEPAPGLPGSFRESGGFGGHQSGGFGGLSQSGGFGGLSQSGGLGGFGGQEPPQTGVCRSVNTKNVLDIPRFTITGGQYGVSPSMARQPGLATSPDFGGNKCCPTGTTWVAVKGSYNDPLALDRGIKAVHCCGGPLPKNRFDALAKYRAGCKGGRKAGAVWGKFMMGHATNYELDTSGLAVSDDTAAASDDGLTPYTAEEVELLETADGAAAADADVADAVGGEDVMADAPAPLEFAAAPAAEHVL